MTTTYADIDSITSPRVVGRSTVRPCAERSSAPARLTRRGRLVVLLVVFAVAYAALTLLSGPAASTHQVHHATAHTVVVEPGQTLWDIAAEASPTADPRQVVAEIMDLNSLSDAGTIRAGQPLFVPAG